MTVSCLAHSRSSINKYWMNKLSLHQQVKESQSLVTQPHLTLCDPGSSVYGIFQAGILEWAVISSSRESSRPKDRTQVSSIADRCFTIWDTREAPHQQGEIPKHWPHLLKGACITLTIRRKWRVFFKVVGALGILSPLFSLQDSLPMPNPSDLGFNSYLSAISTHVTQLGLSSWNLMFPGSMFQTYPSSPSLPPHPHLLLFLFSASVTILTLHPVIEPGILLDFTQHINTPSCPDIHLTPTLPSPLPPLVWATLSSPPSHSFSLCLPQLSLHILLP